MPLDDSTISALIEARLGDPFAVLGMHQEGDTVVVRAWVRHAKHVRVHHRDNAIAPVALPQRLGEGLFEGPVPDAAEPFPYELGVTYHGSDHEHRVRDPFSFWPSLSDWDLERFAEGRHYNVENVLGAQPMTIDGCEGVRFAVWAPNAQRVSVIGDWNGFDGRYHPMRRRHPSGVWEIFIPEARPWMHYKYEIRQAHGGLVAKADPYAKYAQHPPHTASIIAPVSEYEWNDQAWLDARAARAGQWRHHPLAIYECHLGSWQRGENGRILTYREIAPRLTAHCTAMGFNVVELLPIAAFPLEASWGYQITGFYAVSPRYGTPDDLRYLVDTLHQAGIGVFMDFVPAHFPKDDFSLRRFDGTACYEYDDPREGEQKDWGTLIFNFRRPEVRNFLLGAALRWLRDFHMDGLRIDAVSAMLYRDYSRKHGEWVPNEYGGKENIEALEWLREFTSIIRTEIPGALTIAEESTSFGGVTGSPEHGGLGFDLKWNMGWMHDTLRYLSQDPVFRSGVHDWITFHQWYAYDEAWVLPLSHDEVVHGKGSLLDKMPGDYWQRLAQLRLLFGYQCGVPGRPMLFQGGEIGQGREWAETRSIDWHEGGYPERAALAKWVGEAIRLYRREPALHERDDEREGFQWVECTNRADSILAFIRHAPGRHPVLVACNFTPVPRPGYYLNLCQVGMWDCLLSSDDGHFHGSGTPMPSQVEGYEGGGDGFCAHGLFDLPPLGIVFYRAPFPDDGVPLVDDTSKQPVP